MVKNKKCINDDKKSYTGKEPSPKGLGYCAHASKLNEKRKGRDGNIWIVSKTSNNIKRWIKFNKDYDLKKYKLYTPYYNGYPSANQKVYIKKNDVLVFSMYDKNNNKYKNDTKENLIKKIKAKKIFIGKNTKTITNKLSGAIGKKYDNSTILIYLGTDKYILLDGNKIKNIKMNDTIVSFHAPVGNSGVPYPYAIGKKYIHSFLVPIGKLPIKYFPNIKNQMKLSERIDLLDPFFEKKMSISIGDFVKILDKKLDKIEIDDLSKIYKAYDIEKYKKIGKKKFDKNKTRRENLIHFIENFTSIKFKR